MRLLINGMQRALITARYGPDEPLPLILEQADLWPIGKENVPERFWIRPSHDGDFAVRNSASQEIGNRNAFHIETIR